MRAPLPPLFALLLLTACPPGEETGSTTAPTSPATGETGEAGDTGVTPATAEIELVATFVGADDLNPFGDGSGMVEFVATDLEATRFSFEMGDGTTVESATGEVAHLYATPGTNDFDVTVTSFSDADVRGSRTESITVYRSDVAFPKLVWADEFDVDGAPDPDRWHHQVIPPENGGWFNNELQHYTDRLDNSYVSDGTLKIVAIKEPYTVNGSLREYTSARLNSKFAFRYGRVDVRAQLPAEGGTWPAIWTLGANIDEIGNAFGSTYGSVGWPACGEIDILEQLGGDKQRTIAHFHWGNTVTSAYENEGGSIANPDSTTAFHTYSLVWDADWLRIFVDDQLVHELANTADRPYDNLHYLLLNVAMGGNLGGSIPGGFTDAMMEIDYVRVYGPR